MPVRPRLGQPAKSHHPRGRGRLLLARHRRIRANPIEGASSCACGARSSGSARARSGHVPKLCRMTARGLEALPRLATTMAPGATRTHRSTPSSLPAVKRPFPRPSPTMCVIGGNRRRRQRHATRIQPADRQSSLAGSPRALLQVWRSGTRVGAGKRAERPFLRTGQRGRAGPCGPRSPKSSAPDHRPAPRARRPACRCRPPPPSPPASARWTRSSALEPTQRRAGARRAVPSVRSHRIALRAQAYAAAATMAGKPASSLSISRAPALGPSSEECRQAGAALVRMDSKPLT